MGIKVSDEIVKDDEFVKQFIRPCIAAQLQIYFEQYLKELEIEIIERGNQDNPTGFAIMEDVK